MWKLKLLLVTALATGSQNDDRLFRQGVTQLQNWQWEAAAGRLDAIAEPTMRSLLHSQVALVTGDYPTATKHITKATPPRLLELIVESNELLGAHQVLRQGQMELRVPRTFDRSQLSSFHQAFSTGRASIEATLGLTIDDVVRIELVATRDELARISGVDGSTFIRSGAHGFCQRGKIAMVLPTAYPSLDWRATLTHELTHWAIMRKHGTAIPRWLHEALAVYMERREEDSLGESKHHSKPLAVDMAFPRSLPFDGAERPTSYRIARELAVFAIDQGGDNNLRRLLEVANNDIGKTFQAALGMEQCVIDSKWSRFLAR